MAAIPYENTRTAPPFLDWEKRAMEGLTTWLTISGPSASLIAAIGLGVAGPLVAMYGYWRSHLRWYNARTIWTLYIVACECLAFPFVVLGLAPKREEGVLSALVPITTILSAFVGLAAAVAFAILLDRQSRHPR